MIGKYLIFITLESPRGARKNINTKRWFQAGKVAWKRLSLRSCWDELRTAFRPIERQVSSPLAKLMPRVRLSRARRHPTIGSTVRERERFGRLRSLFTMRAEGKWHRSAQGCRRSHCPRWAQEPRQRFGDSQQWNVKSSRRRLRLIL